MPVFVWRSVCGIYLNNKPEVKPYLRGNLLKMGTTKQSFMLPVLGIGFLIWLAATLAFRLAGQYFFITTSPATLVVLYTAVVPSLALISVATFKKFQLSGFEYVAAGVLLVLPGMVIDTFVIQFFGSVFPICRPPEQQLLVPG